MINSPNHAIVKVVSARNLICRNKNGKNDAFIVMQLGAEKFRTSIKQKSTDPFWDEQAEFVLPNKYCVLTLIAYHRNFIGLDDFLGQIKLPVDEICDINETPRNRWYPLKGKSGKTDEHKYRGELQLCLTFSHRPEREQEQPKREHLAHDRLTSTAGHDSERDGGPSSSSGASPAGSPRRLSVNTTKPSVNHHGSFKSLTLPHATSLHSLKSVATSALAAKKFATLNRLDSSKQKLKSGKNKMKSVESLPDLQVPKDIQSVRSPKIWSSRMASRRGTEDLDVVREVPTELDVDDFRNGGAAFDVSSSSAMSSLSNRNEDQRLSGRSFASSGCEPGPEVRTLDLLPRGTGPALPYLESKSQGTQKPSSYSLKDMSITNIQLISETLPKQDLVDMIKEHRREIAKKDRRMKELEEYIDRLLLRVMDDAPHVLQAPIIGKRPHLY